MHNNVGHPKPKHVAVFTLCPTKRTENLMRRMRRQTILHFSALNCKLPVSVDFLDFRVVLRSLFLHILLVRLRDFIARVN